MFQHQSKWSAIQLLLLLSSNCAIAILKFHSCTERIISMEKIILIWLCKFKSRRFTSMNNVNWWSDSVGELNSLASRNFNANLSHTISAAINDVKLRVTSFYKVTFRGLGVKNWMQIAIKVELLIYAVDIIEMLNKMCFSSC